MLANIKPGKPARLAGAITTPYISALIEAKRRGAPLEPVMTKIMRELGFDPPRRRRIADRLGDLMFFSASFHDFFMAHFVGLGETLRTSISPLSRREKQCLELAANVTSVGIGAKLGVKQRTANFHSNNLIQKMGVLNRLEAIAVDLREVGFASKEPASPLVVAPRGHYPAPRARGIASSFSLGATQLHKEQCDAH
jgi:DNA-binding CsgD family transcriptional regulator